MNRGGGGGFTTTTGGHKTTGGGGGGGSGGGGGGVNGHGSGGGGGGGGDGGGSWLSQEFMHGHDPHLIDGSSGKALIVPSDVIDSLSIFTVNQYGVDERFCMMLEKTGTVSIVIMYGKFPKSVRSSVKLLPEIKGLLSMKPNRENLFRDTVFGPWLDIQSHENDSHIMHYVFQHQGEYKWEKFYNRTLNVVSRHTEHHLDQLKKNPKFNATYNLYGFAWAFKMSNPNVPLIASPEEMSHAWFKDSAEFITRLDAHRRLFSSRWTNVEKKVWNSITECVVTLKMVNSYVDDYMSMFNNEEQPAKSSLNDLELQQEPDIVDVKDGF
ncbi:hypothetical protein Tco_1018363 [Tanacetum coccineum]|uniref:Uncharacterized protein n=1 Tax=Tanacetum coccineum TaxID=301880 RepID=A0ABQ5FU44_9ASTR